MRVVVAHGRAEERRRLRGVLTAAGHEVMEADGDALSGCLECS